nr:MAG TPA: hypothetical protein [Caudoviricetes sp.]
MTYEVIIEALRACNVTACTDCPLNKDGEDCASLNTEAASALEDLVELARNNEKRECEAEEHTENLRRMLARKQTELNILRSELRRMFQLYVAAEMRADTGVSEGVDDA